jgi:Uma2 family endonuclease
MTRLAAEPRAFVPGTTGWTASDLDDPKIEREWFRGHYEIIEGVLTTMPPAYFAGHGSLENLIFLVKSHLKAKGQPSSFGQEIDIVISETRVVRADAVYLTRADKSRQVRAARSAEREDPDRTRVLVPPTLVIESISPGHEQHDEGLKRRWYAEFGIPHYWLLNAFDRSLRCLALRDGVYRVDATGKKAEKVRPSLFPGLVIPLADAWEQFED